MLLRDCEISKRTPQNVIAIILQLRLQIKVWGNNNITRDVRLSDNEINAIPLNIPCSFRASSD